MGLQQFRMNPKATYNTAFFWLILLQIGILLYSHRGIAYRGGGTTVLIARDIELSGFEYRIKAELEAVGFNVKMFEMDFREDTRRIMDNEAHTHNAAAAIVCRRAAGFVEIWISDKVTNKNVLRQVAIPEDEDAEAFVALSAVELLRASLLEIHTATQLTGTVAPSPEIVKLISPNAQTEPSLQHAKDGPDKFSLQLNPALFVLRFKDNPLLNIQIGASYILFNAFELKLHGQSPILPHKIEHENGATLVRTGYVATGLNWILVYPKQAASGDIGIGWACLFHRVTGQPMGGKIGHERTFVTSAPHITIGMDVRIANKMRFRFETIAGWSLSKINLTVAGQKIATLGNLFLSVGAGFLFSI